MGIGSFSRYCWRISSSTAGSRSSPAMINAGSPGSNCCRPKISIDTRIRVGMICSRRWVRKASIGLGASCLVFRTARVPEKLLQLDADDPDQTVGHLLVAVDPVAERHQHQAVIEVLDGAVGQIALGDVFVDLLALGGIALDARLLVPLVDILVAVARIVLRRAAGLEGEGVAVGI